MLNYQTYRKIVHMACEPAAKDDKEMEKVSFISGEIVQFLMSMSDQSQYKQQDILAALDFTTYEIARLIYQKAVDKKKRDSFTPSP